MVTTLRQAPSKSARQLTGARAVAQRSNMVVTVPVLSQATPSTGMARALWRKQRLRLGISLVVAIAFAWCLERGGLPLLPPRQAFDDVKVGHCVAAAAILIAVHLVRAARWRHLLAPIATGIALRRILAVSFIGFAAILIMPLRAGELVRPYMIRQKGKISVAAASGTIAAERIIDGLGLTILLVACMSLAPPLSPLPDHIGKLQIPVAAVPFYAFVAVGGFTAALAMMALFYWRPIVGRKVVEHSLGRVSKPAGQKVAAFVERTAEGLQFLPSVRHLVPFLIETAIYLLLNAASIWVLALGCGIGSISYAQACVVMGVLGLGILVPAGPGLFGAFQASSYAALAMYFHDDVVLGAGTVFVFLLYALTGVLHVVAAAIALLHERNAAREVLEAEIA